MDRSEATLRSMTPESAGLGHAALRSQLQRQLESREWVAAWPGLQALLSHQPDDAWALQWQAVAALALGHLDVAVQSAQAALAALPAAAVQSRADVAFNLGQALGLWGRPAAALAAFDQVLALQPGNLDAQLGRAKALGQLGRHADAGRAATAVLQQRPEHLEALGLVANGLVKADAPARALQCFLRYEHLKPGSAFTACMAVFLMRQLADWRLPPLPVSTEEGRVLEAAAR